MSKNRLPAYPALANELRSASLGINPAELQGLLTGMLSGGLSLNDKSWQALVSITPTMAWAGQLVH